MSIRQQVIMKEDFDTRLEVYSGLFSDIMHGVIGLEDLIPPMPASLMSYTSKITNDQARTEASAVFIVWLRGRSSDGAGGDFTSRGISRAVPCGDEDVITAFVPDFPFEDECNEGAGGIEFRAAYAVAEIDRAVAKQVCINECPIRIQCLARSIKADGGIYPRPLEVEPWAVSGGWGEGARATIAAKFHEFRRNYLNDRMIASERMNFEKAAREQPTAV